MKDKNDCQEAWLFKFSLESENKLEINMADALMNEIIEWAERNKCQIGGGYRKPNDGEFDDAKLFEIVQISQICFTLNLCYK